MKWPSPHFCIPWRWCQQWEAPHFQEGSEAGQLGPGAGYPGGSAQVSSTTPNRHSGTPAHLHVMAPRLGGEGGILAAPASLGGSG